MPNTSYFIYLLYVSKVYDLKQEKKIDTDDFFFFFSVCPVFKDDFLPQPTQKENVKMKQNM